MRKISLFFVLLVGLSLLAFPAMAEEDDHEEHDEDNAVGTFIHILSIILAIVVIVFAFMAAGMFAQELGNAMKIVGVGMAFLAVNNGLEELHHFGFTLLSPGIAHSAMHHMFGGIGYILLAYGFYKVYTVAKGVSTGSSSKSK